MEVEVGTMVFYIGYLLPLEVVEVDNLVLQAVVVDSYYLLIVHYQWDSTYSMVEGILHPLAPLGHLALLGLHLDHLP